MIWKHPCYLKWKEANNTLDIGISAILLAYQEEENLKVLIPRIKTFGQYRGGLPERGMQVC